MKHRLLIVTTVLAAITMHATNVVAFIRPIIGHH